MERRFTIILFSAFVMVSGIFGTSLSRNVSQTDVHESSLVFFIQDVIREDMNECNLVIFFANESQLTSIIPAVHSLPMGVTLINFDNFNTDFLSNFKNEMFYGDTKVCLSYLFLYENKYYDKMVEAGEQFWVGERKIFIIAIDQSDKNDMNVLMTHPTFRSDNLLFPSLKNQDFAGYTFTVAALPYSPFVIERDTTATGPGRYRGLEIDLLDSVAAYANFTYRYTAPADGQWGKQLEDGSWTGMVGMVGREEAEFAISDIAPSLLRLTFVDFGDIFVFDASELITPRALPLPLWLGPIRPFSYEVWVGVFIICIAAALFLYIISALTPFNNDDTWFESFGNCLICAILPLLMRGNAVNYKADPGRLFLSIWLVTAMIISIFYTSSLTSFLILPGYTKPIENLEQLVTSDIGWAKVDFGGLQNELLEKATDPTLKALGRGVEWRNDLDGILEEVVAGKIATWENAITTNLKVAVQYSDKNGQPLVYFTGYALLQERISWPIQKHAPFKTRFDILINRVVQSGLMNKFFEDIILEEQRRQREKDSNDANQDEEEDEISQIVLNIDHFQGPFFVIGVGYAIGFVCFIAEIVAHKLLHKKGK